MSTYSFLAIASAPVPPVGGGVRVRAMGEHGNGSFLSLSRNVGANAMSNVQDTAIVIVPTADETAMWTALTAGIVVAFHNAAIMNSVRLAAAETVYPGITTSSGRNKASARERFDMFFLEHAGPADLKRQHKRAGWLLDNYRDTIKGAVQTRLAELDKDHDAEASTAAIAAGIAAIVERLKSDGIVKQCDLDGKVWPAKATMTALEKAEKRVKTLRDQKETAERQEAEKRTAALPDNRLASIVAMLDDFAANGGMSEHFGRIVSKASGLYHAAKTAEEIAEKAAAERKTAEAA